MRLNYIDNCDCLEGMKQIPDGSVDLVLTDPPYGMMKGGGKAKQEAFRDMSWDTRIPSGDLLQHFARVLRPNGKAVIFSQGDYTAELMTQAPPVLPFCYRAIWLKDQFANFLGVNKAMVSVYEDICVFSKLAPKHDFEGENPLRAYFGTVLRYIGPDEATARKTVLGAIGGRADHTTRVNSTQFTLCTEPVYRELVERFRLEAMPGFRPYGDLREQEDRYRTDLIERMNTEAPSVFNLWQGGKSKANVLTYPKDMDGFHPTQKPLALIEDLAQTFSDPDDTVLDPFMGSGTTAAACIRTGRNYIGFELSKEYHAIAQQRIADTVDAMLEEVEST